VGGNGEPPKSPLKTFAIKGGWFKQMPGQQVKRSILKRSQGYKKRSLEGNNSGERGNGAKPSRIAPKEVHLELIFKRARRGEAVEIGCV